MIREVPKDRDTHVAVRTWHRCLYPIWTCLLIFDGNLRNLVFSPTDRRDHTTQQLTAPLNPTMDQAKLAKLQAQAALNRIGTSTCRTEARCFVFYVCSMMVLTPACCTRLPGGKGTVRRKIVRKSKPANAQDDKKLQGALKKLNVQPITGVEEVNMFREDGNVLHFSAPKGEPKHPFV